MVETAVCVIVGVICGTILGFWLGRLSAKYYVGETEEERRERMDEDTDESDWSSGRESGKQVPESQENRNAGRAEQNRLWYDRRAFNEAGVFVIGSPVNGVVTDYNEGRRPEIVLYPAEEKLYAPTGGKVIRLLPLGNEILFRTEAGAVLRMKVGDGADELQSEYFRPKAIQNEVVNKGKILLEYDKKALEAEGIECNVSVRVEEAGISEKVLNIADGRVKVGEGIFEICRM